MYHEILLEKGNLERTAFEGPNAKAGESKAARRLLRELIPQYRQVVPMEVQQCLAIDLDKLERRCRLYGP